MQLNDEDRLHLSFFSSSFPFPSDCIEVEIESGSVNDDVSILQSSNINPDNADIRGRVKALVAEASNSGKRRRTGESPVLLVKG